MATKIKNKWKNTIITLTIIAAILTTMLTYIYLFERALFIQYFSEAEYTSFPLGEKNTITIDKNIYFKERYCIGNRIEFINGNIDLYGDSYRSGEFFPNDNVYIKQRSFIGDPGIPSSKRRTTYTIRVIAYKYDYKKEEYMNFFTKEYNNHSNFYTTGSRTNNEFSLAFKSLLDCFILERGKYRFIFIDKSIYLSDFKSVIYSIRIYPDSRRN